MSKIKSPEAKAMILNAHMISYFNDMYEFNCLAQEYLFLKQLSGKDNDNHLKELKESFFKVKSQMHKLFIRKEDIEEFNRKELLIPGIKFLLNSLRASPFINLKSTRFRDLYETLLKQGLLDDEQQLFSELGEFSKLVTLILTQANSTQSKEIEKELDRETSEAKFDNNSASQIPILTMQYIEYLLHLDTLSIDTYINYLANNCNELDQEAIIKFIQKDLKETIQEGYLGKLESALKQRLSPNGQLLALYDTTLAREIIKLTKMKYILYDYLTPDQQANFNQLVILGENALILMQIPKILDLSRSNSLFIKKVNDIITKVSVLNTEIFYAEDAKQKINILVVKNIILDLENIFARLDPYEISAIYLSELKNIIDLINNHLVNIERYVKDRDLNIDKEIDKLKNTSSLLLSKVNERLEKQPKLDKKFVEYLALLSSSLEILTKPEVTAQEIKEIQDKIVKHNKNLSSIPQDQLPLFKDKLISIINKYGQNYNEEVEKALAVNFNPALSLINDRYNISIFETYASKFDKIYKYLDGHNKNSKTSKKPLAEFFKIPDVGSFSTNDIREFIRIISQISQKIHNMPKKIIILKELIEKQVREIEPIIKKIDASHGKLPRTTRFNLPDIKFDVTNEGQIEIDIEELQKNPLAGLMLSDTIFDTSSSSSESSTPTEHQILAQKNMEQLQYFQNLRQESQKSLKRVLEISALSKALAFPDNEDDAPVFHDEEKEVFEAQAPKFGPTSAPEYLETFSSLDLSAPKQKEKIKQANAIKEVADTIKEQQAKFDLAISQIQNGEEIEPAQADVIKKVADKIREQQAKPEKQDEIAAQLKAKADKAYNELMNEEKTKKHAKNNKKKSKAIIPNKDDNPKPKPPLVEVKQEQVKAKNEAADMAREAADIAYEKAKLELAKEHKAAEAERKIQLAEEQNRMQRDKIQALERSLKAATETNTQLIEQDKKNQEQHAEAAQNIAKQKSLLDEQIKAKEQALADQKSAEEKNIRQNEKIQALKRSLKATTEANKQLIEQEKIQSQKNQEQFAEAKQYIEKQERLLAEQIKAKELALTAQKSLPENSLNNLSLKELNEEFRKEWDKYNGQDTFQNVSAYNGGILITYCKTFLAKFWSDNKAGSMTDYLIGKKNFTSEYQSQRNPNPVGLSAENFQHFEEKSKESYQAGFQQAIAQLQPKLGEEFNRGFEQGAQQTLFTFSQLIQSSNMQTTYPQPNIFPFPQQVAAYQSPVSPITQQQSPPEAMSWQERVQSKILRPSASPNQKEMKEQNGRC